MNILFKNTNTADIWTLNLPSWVVLSTLCFQTADTSSNNAQTKAWQNRQEWEVKPSISLVSSTNTRINTCCPKLQPNEITKVNKYEMSMCLDFKRSSMFKQIFCMMHALADMSGLLWGDGTLNHVCHCAA